MANNGFASAIGTPEAHVTPNGHRFGGWWTESVAGTQITSGTQVANNGNREEVDPITQIYARWLQNDAIIERVHYDGSIEDAGIHTVWLAGAISEPLPINSPGNGQVFSGWWTQDGTGGVWGERVTASTFITTDQHTAGTPIRIYARWQVYVSAPIVTNINISQGALTWSTLHSVDRFYITIVGSEDPPIMTTGTTFDFSGFAPGTHTISIVAANSGGVESVPTVIAVVIPTPTHTPVVTIRFVGYNDQVLQTMVVGVDENADVAPSVPDRPDGTRTFRFVRWEMSQVIAQNGDITQTFLAIWEEVLEDTTTEIKEVRFVDSRVTGGFATVIRAVDNLATDIAKPTNWTRTGYVLSWETTIVDDTMVFTAVWTAQTQDQAPSFVRGTLPWILIAASGLLVLISIILLTISLRNRRQKYATPAQR